MQNNALPACRPHLGTCWLLNKQTPRRRDKAGKPLQTSRRVKALSAGQRYNLGEGPAGKGRRLNTAGARNDAELLQSNPQALRDPEEHTGVEQGGIRHNEGVPLSHEVCAQPSVLQMSW